MAIKKYSKVKFTLRKELIIILASILVLIVATILFNLPTKGEEFLTKWSETGISENHVYEEVTFDELENILKDKKSGELTFVFFATPSDTDSVTYFSQIITYADEADVDKVYIVDSAFVTEGSREDEEFDNKLKEIEGKFRGATVEGEETKTIKLDSPCNLWLFDGNTLIESVDDYEKNENDKWGSALVQIFAEAYPEKSKQ